jgi:TPR repeat protein
MNLIGIFIGLVGLLLIFSVIWMMIVSVRQKNHQSEKLARMDAHRRAVKRDHALEKNERIKKAGEGHIPSILFLAKEAELRDLKEAIYWYEQAALLANPIGMYGVVRLCSRFNQDAVLVEKSRFWQRYIQGIEGNLDALFETGKALIMGHGITCNLELGIKTVERAALAHHVGAQIYMGDWCLSDDSSKLEEANYWFAKAANLDSRDAMIKLGRNYLKGRGIAKSHKMGCFWLEYAAERGSTRAMYYAGKAWIDMGSHGNSIAYIWLYMASELNYAPAKTLRDEVANKLGVDSLVVLQGFANPLLKKLKNGVMTRHIIIRALNRLYSRDIPILTSRDLEDEVDQADELLLSQLLAQDTKETTPDSKQVPPAALS